QQQRTPLPWLRGSDASVLSFREWCQLNGIGERTGRRILKSGNGPAVVQLSERRIGIRLGDNRTWQASRVRGGRRRRKATGGRGGSSQDGRRDDLLGRRIGTEATSQRPACLASVYDGQRCADARRALARRNLSITLRGAAP